MAGIVRYSTSRVAAANADVLVMAREHIKSAVVAFLVAVVALPLAAWGTDLRHEAWEVFADGVIGPCLLYGVVFLYFWARQPAKLDAKRVAEIRELRLAQGLSIADLEPAPTSAKSRSKSSRIITAVVWMLSLGAVGAVGLYDYITEVDIENTLGADGRHIWNIQPAAHRMKEHVDKIEKENKDQATVLEQNKEEAGRLTKEIVELKRQLSDAAKNSPRPTIEYRSAPLKSRFAGQLQSFYGNGSEIIRMLLSPNITDAQIDQKEIEANNWVNQTNIWINKTMSEPAAQRFLKPSSLPGLSYDLPGQHANGEQAKRNNIANALNTWLANLEIIMASPEWDPP